MTQETMKRLERIKGYGTRYEVVAVGDGRTILLGYTARKNGRGLWAMLVARRDHLVRVCGGDRVEVKKDGRDYVSTNGWRFRFTGRTQRECIISGEREFIEDVA